MTFYSSYKAVFDAIKAVLVYVPAVPYSPAIPAHDDVPEVSAVPAHDGVPEVPFVPGVPAHGVSSIKTVIVGEQFSYGLLPKAIINAEPAPIAPAEMGGMLNVSVFFSVVLCSPGV